MFKLKKYTTVVISGEGADELFGGYGRVQRSPMDFKKIKFVKIFPAIFHKSLLKIMGAGNNLDSWLKVNNHMEHFFLSIIGFHLRKNGTFFLDTTMDIIKNDNSNIEYWANDFEKVAGGNEYDRIIIYVSKKPFDLFSRSIRLNVNG